MLTLLKSVLANTCALKSCGFWRPAHKTNTC